VLFIYAANTYVLLLEMQFYHYLLTAIL